ncbi:MAG: glycoside hydrolase family 2 TIM barrel-domain containing protein [Planctomycetia bacterium]|nr:glycoside hydrolase family 2 TIM barrel-domain containing protein [Planctomycetia bacterium]
MRFHFTALILFALLCKYAYATEGSDSWGGRTAVPAVVNSITAIENDRISLSGPWEFMTRQVDFAGGSCMMPDSQWTNAREIEVPGCWESQGGGSGPAESVVWDYYQSRKVAGQSITLKNSYNGNAWYRKWLEVPKEWKGQRVWLAVGGVNAKGWFYINGQRVALVENFCGTFKYDVTDLIKFGERNLVAVRVRNDLPNRKGCMTCMHAFGGLYRSLELQVTPQASLQDVWVRGNVDTASAEIHVELDRSKMDVESSKEFQLLAVLTDSDGREVGRTQNNVTLEKGTCSPFILTVPIEGFEPWSPEHPVLYFANVTLSQDGSPLQERRERFGVRKFEVRGDRFYLNNKPFFMRAFGDDAIYLNTLSSPASVEEHRKTLSLAKRSGFNAVRLHTHCEVPEYFEAADELGIMIQAEIPYYGEFPTGGFDFDPMRDLRELYQHYRRYPSFAIYSMGNEGYLGSPLDQQLYQFVKNSDADRLVIHQDGGMNSPGVNSDFVGGPIDVWRDSQTQHKVPFVAHEYLNISIKHDPRWEPLFTGATLPLRPLAEYETELAHAGLSRDWGDACLDAAQYLQKYYQKSGIESARKDPACDGFCFWTITDTGAPDRGVATSQGLFSPFWTIKNNGSTPEDFYVFNQPVVLLAKIANDEKIFTSGSVMNVEWMVSNYGDSEIVKPQFVWQLIDSDGNICSQGDFQSDSIQTGQVQTIANTECLLPDLNNPQKMTLKVSITGTNFSNSWNVWCFPQRIAMDGNDIAIAKEYYNTLASRYPGATQWGTPESASAKLVIGTMQDVQEAARQGKRCILLDPPGGKPNVKLGWWWLGDQVGTAFARHEAFGDFPHNGALDPLWFRLIKTGAPLVPDSPFFGAEYLAVGEGQNKYFVYAGQMQAGSGKIIFIKGIDLITETLEGTWLLDNLVRYARSERFNPTATTKFMESFDRQNESLIGLNGWATTMRCAKSQEGNYFFGPGVIDLALFESEGSCLEWKTIAMNDNFTDASFTLTWLGGFGKLQASPDGVESLRERCSLFVNNNKIMDFQIDGSQNSWEVKSDTAVLQWETLTRNPKERTGKFSLTLPSSILEPGSAAIIRIDTADSKGLSWFGILEKQ